MSLEPPTCIVAWLTLVQLPPRSPTPLIQLPGVVANLASPPPKATGVAFSRFPSLSTGRVHCWSRSINVRALRLPATGSLHLPRIAPSYGSFEASAPSNRRDRAAPVLSGPHSRRLYSADNRRRGRSWGRYPSCYRCQRGQVRANCLERRRKLRSKYAAAYIAYGGSGNGDFLVFLFVFFPLPSRQKLTSPRVSDRFCDRE